MAVVAIAIGTAVVGSLIYGGIQQSNANDIMEDQTQLTEDKIESELQLQAQAQAELKAQRDEYKQFKFENVYANMENVYTGMENVYKGARNVYDTMENVYEDMQVSTAAADFQLEQGAQQRANILSGLSSAAGSSGIAGLAQTLAQQGTIQARQASVDLSQQQQANERLRAQGAAQVQAAQLGEEARLQQLTLSEQARIDMVQRQGAGAVQMAQLGGEQFVQEAEMARQSNLLGLAYGGAAGAGANVQQAYANQMNAMSMQAGMYQQNAQMAYNMAGQVTAFAGNYYGAGGAGAK